MATGQLSWDYGDTTGDSSGLTENSPLLNGLTTTAGTFYSVNSDPQGCRLTQKQVHFLLRNLESSASLLRAYLREVEQSEAAGDHGDDIVVLPGHIDASPCCAFWGQLKKIMTSNVLVITLVLQALNIALLSIIDSLPDIQRHEKTTIIGGCIVMILLEVVNLVVLFVITAKLTRQMLAHNVSGMFLAASYVATILVFAGIYMATFRLDKSSWKSIAEDFQEDPIAIDLYVKMVYLSVSTATLCGSCSVTPKKWFNYGIMSIQMLFSFLYFAQIMALAIPTQWPPKVTVENVDSQDTSSANPRYQRRGSVTSQGSRHSVPAESAERSPRQHTLYGSTT